MTTIIKRTDVTKAINADRGSFERAVSELCNLSTRVKEIKKYLSQRGYSIAYLKQKNEEKHLVCKSLMSQLPMEEFETEKGVKYMSIYRYDKKAEKNVPKKWTIALVLQCIDKQFMSDMGAKNIADAIKTYQEEKAMEEAKKAAEKAAAIEAAEKAAAMEEAKRKALRNEGKAKRTNAAAIKAAAKKNNKKAA